MKQVQLRASLERYWGSTYWPCSYCCNPGYTYSLEKNVWIPYIMGAWSIGLLLLKTRLLISLMMIFVMPCVDGQIFLETFSPLYRQAYDFFIAIAEPVFRPESMHEYNLTLHSLYAAVYVGLETETIFSVLNKLSWMKLSKDMIDFIYSSTDNYGKMKLVLEKNRYLLQSPFPVAK